MSLLGRITRRQPAHIARTGRPAATVIPYRPAQSSTAPTCTSCGRRGGRWILRIEDTQRFTPSEDLALCADCAGRVAALCHHGTPPW